MSPKVASLVDRYEKGVEVFAQALKGAARTWGTIRVAYNL